MDEGISARERVARRGATHIQTGLRGSVNLAAELSRVEGHRPAPGSIADTELRGEDEILAAEAENAYSLANLLQLAAGDCLETLARLVEEPIPQIGLLTCGRASIEHSVRGWWLLDPGVDTAHRAARGLTERLASAHAAAVVGSRPRSSRSKEELRLAQRAEALGFTVQVPKLQYRLSISGIHRPSATELFHEMFGDLGADAHRFFSASAHGTAFALVAANEPNLDAPPTGSFLRPHRDFPWIGVALCLAPMSYLNGLERLTYLLGWSQDEFRSWRRRIWGAFKGLLPEAAAPSANHLPGWDRAD